MGYDRGFLYNYNTINNIKVSAFDTGNVRKRTLFIIEPIEVM